MSEIRVICGRFSGVGEERSIAVGYRLVAPHSRTPNAVLRVTAFEYRDGELHVRLDCEDSLGRGLAGLIREDFIFAIYKPAPPESRWLEPTSVPIGHPLRTCTFEGECSFPAQIHTPRIATYQCAAHNYLAPGEWPVTKALCPFPANALTPVPRWRSLLGTHWSCGRPERVAFAARLDRTAARATWLVSYRGYPPTGRVRKVRAGYSQIHIPPSTEPERRAKWVLA